MITLCVSTYAAGYYCVAARPGRSQIQPEGWWGWFDQGRYLLESVAMAHGDFSPDKYFYPPLYPLLGAMFVRWWEQHPFLIVNLVCFLVYSIVFLRFCRLFVPSYVAFGLFVFSVLANRFVFENFLIPWTSTLSVALLSLVIFGLMRLWENQQCGQAIPSWIAVVTGLAAGLVVAVRPLDVLVAGCLWLVFCCQLWRGCKCMGHSESEAVRRILASATALGIGPMLFVGFNWLMYGTIGGAYLSAATGNGYYIADCAEKVVSIVLDGYSLYLEPKSGLVERYPWLIVSVPAVVYLVIGGTWLLRASAIAVCLQFGLYLPYGDLLPTSLWRYLNIHYFKWAIPYLALFGCLLPIVLIREWRTDRRKALLYTAVVSVCGALLLCLQFGITIREGVVSREGGDADVRYPLQIEVAAEPIDFIDVRGVSSGFLEVYFGKHRLWIDVCELQRVKEFRVVPAPWGMRILFIRPVVGKRVTFQPDDRIGLPRPSWSIGIGCYHFALGVPRWFAGAEKHFLPSLGPDRLLE